MRYISIILVDSALRKERQMTYETYREKANDMALEIEELRGKVKDQAEQIKDMRIILNAQQDLINAYRCVFKVCTDIEDDRGNNDSKL